MRIRTTARSQAAVISAARLVAAVLGIATPVVIVRVLDQAAFGGYKQFFLWSATLTSVATMALPQSLFHLVPKLPHKSQRLIEQTLVALIFIGLCCGAVIWLGAPYLRGVMGPSFASWAPWLALSLCLSVPAGLLSVLPMVDRDALTAAKLLTGFEVLRTGGVISAALIFRTVESVVVATMIVWILQYARVVHYVIERRKRHTLLTDEQVLREQLSYSLPLSATVLVGIGRDQLHAFFVSARRSASDFALYAVGTLSVPFIGQISQSISEVLVLEASAHVGSGEHEQLRRVWYRVVRVLALLLFPIFAMLEWTGEDVLVLLYGSVYSASAEIFRLNLLMVPLSILLLTSPLLRASGRAKAMLLADLASLAATAGSITPLVSRFGMSGAVLCLLLGNVVFICATAPSAARALGVSIMRVFPILDLVWIAVLALLAFGAGYALSRGLPSALRILATGAVGGGLYLGASWRLGLIPDSEQLVVLQLLNRMRGLSRSLWTRDVR